MKNIIKNSYLFGVFLLTFGYAYHAEASNDATALHELFQAYYEENCSFNPLQATADGFHQFDDLLPNEGSIDFIEAKKAFCHRYLNALNAFDRAQLNESDRISFDVLAYALNTEIEGLSLHLEYLPFNQFVANAPLDLAQFGSGEGPQPFHTKKDYENWSKRMIAFKDWADTAIANFEKGIQAGVVLPKALVVKMIPQMEALATRDRSKNVFYRPLRLFPTTMSKIDQEQITTLYQHVIEAYTIPAYEELAYYLKTRYLKAAKEEAGLSALPNGSRIYDYFIRKYTTRKNLSAAAIYEIGLQEVERITKEMENIKVGTHFRGSLSEYFQFLRMDKRFTPFSEPEEVLEAYQQIYKKIQPHLIQLFGHQPATPFVIKRVDAFQEASQGGPFYVKGNLKEKRPGVFYVPVPDAEKINTVFYGMEATFIHEAIPGHHFQIALQQEHTELPLFRKQDAEYAFMEGWALYCESLGEKLGCYTDPYQKMGALNNEIHRAIRLVVDVGIHTGKMTREDAIAYMIKHESVSEVIAEAEIERYMAWPGQALSYKTGELTLKRLRKKYEKQLGRRFELAAFHNAVLNEGIMPLDVLENHLDRWAQQQKP